MKGSALFFLLFLAIISCTDNTTPVIDPPIEEDPVFSLEINGNKWTATEYYYQIKGDGTRVIFATDKVYTYTWEFENELKEKKYAMGTNEKELISSMYKNEDSGFISYDILDGNLEIVKYDKDAQILKCKFSFSAEYNETRERIENGKIYIDKFK